MIRTYLHKNFARFGLAGVGAVAVSSLVTALVYAGRVGERYSALNHFISELGEVGVSPWAWLFNFGLIAGGLLMLPFMIGLTLALKESTRPGWLALLAGASGVVTALSLSAVGVFPMNNLAPHITAAMTFFRSGLVTVMLFGLAIQLQAHGREVVDKRANWASLFAAACYAAFLFYPSIAPGTATGSTSGAVDPLGASFLDGRPAFWPLAVLEWSIFFSTIAWFSVIALASREAKPALKESRAEA